MKKTIFFLTLILVLSACENNALTIVEKTIFVASKKIDCVGVAPQKCLLIKEKESQNWQYFYDAIAGFEYEGGFEYEIIVSETEIENPPQDASSIKTTLVKLVTKVKKTSENLPI